jgi:hypothetical protein
VKAHDDDGFPARDGKALASALIVDDHPLFCDALSMTLKSVAGIAEIETRRPAGDRDPPRRPEPRRRMSSCWT